MYIISILYINFLPSFFFFSSLFSLSFPFPFLFLFFPSLSLPSNKQQNNKTIYNNKNDVFLIYFHSKIITKKVRVKTIVIFLPLTAMRVATFYCLAILALAKCAFGAGTVTVTRPTQEVFGTGACMKMQWTNQGFSQTAVITYKVQFFYEDGTNAFEINPGTTKYTDITFTEGLKNYNYSVLVYENGVHVGSSANRTIIVADTNCYPEKSTYTHSSKIPLPPFY